MRPAVATSPGDRRPAAGGALLCVRHTARGTVVERLRRGERLAPRVLDAGPGAVHACLLPTQAGPLSGDHDIVRITVGPGAALVVEPVVAILALPGPQRTVLEMDITVQAGGRLVLDEGPLVVCAGADVHRRTTLDLEPGAVAALRDIVVLGREGECPGAVDSSLRAMLGSIPLLQDALRLSVRSPREHQHVALAPGHRVVTTVCLLGRRPSEGAADPEVLNLHGPGALRRGTGASLAAVEAATAGVWRAWWGEAMGAAGNA